MVSRTLASGSCKRRSAPGVCAQFKDLNEEIQITPVVELNEAVTIVQKAYKWVDSVS